MALTHMIFEGTLDRYPGLKICGSHGGGYLPSYAGRTDHCAELSNRWKPGKKIPSEYFKQQLYCDSIVFTAESLRHLVAEVGASHVLFVWIFLSTWPTLSWATRAKSIPF